VSIYGVISDVHGNLQALTAVLGALDHAGVDKVICLGDLVGYNGHSNECVELIRARGIDAIAGNHDLIALGRLGFDRCSPKPSFALRRTRKLLDEGSRRFLGQLPPTRSYDGTIALIHGSVDDVCEYMVSPQQIASNAARLRQKLPEVRLCFFGHTHTPKIFEVQGDAVMAREPEAVAELQGGDRLYFVNPGSVDAARRPIKLAEYAVFDSTRWMIYFCRVSYDYYTSERIARSKGLRMGRTDVMIHRVRRWLGKHAAAKRAGAQIPATY
jgi:predicted phosphodiesterase